MFYSHKVKESKMEHEKLKRSLVNITTTTDNVQLPLTVPVNKLRKVLLREIYFSSSTTYTQIWLNVTTIPTINPLVSSLAGHNGLFPLAVLQDASGRYIHDYRDSYVIAEIFPMFGNNPQPITNNFNIYITDNTGVPVTGALQIQLTFEFFADY